MLFVRICGFAVMLGLLGTSSQAAFLSEERWMDTAYEQAAEGAGEIGNRVVILFGTAIITRIPLKPEWLAKAYVRRGLAYDDLSEHADALADFTDAIRLDPENTRAYYERGYLRFRLGYIKKSFDGPQTPDTPTDAELLVDTFSDMDLDVENVSCSVLAYLFTRASTLVDSFGLAGLLVSAADDSNERDFESAIFDLTEAIRRKPDYSEAYFVRAQVHFEREDFIAAENDLSDCIRLSPKNFWAYSARSFVCLRRGALDRAIADLTEAIRLSPNVSVPYRSRGDAFLKKGDIRRAIADYTDAIRLDGRDALAYHGRATAYQQCGEQALAEKDVAQARENGIEDCLRMQEGR